MYQQITKTLNTRFSICLIEYVPEKQKDRQQQKKNIKTRASKFCILYM